MSAGAADDERGEHDGCVAAVVDALVRRGLLVVSTLPRPYGPERYLRSRVEFESADAAPVPPRFGSATHHASHLRAPNGYLVVVTPGRARGWPGSYAEDGGRRSGVSLTSVLRTAERVKTELPRAVTNAELEVLTRARSGLAPDVVRALREASWTRPGVVELAAGLAATTGEPGRAPATSLAVELLRDLADGTPLEWAIRRAVAAEHAS